MRYQLARVARRCAWAEVGAELWVRDLTANRPVLRSWRADGLPTGRTAIGVCRNTTGTEAHTVAVPAFGWDGYPLWVTRGDELGLVSHLLGEDGKPLIFDSRNFELLPEWADAVPLSVLVPPLRRPAVPWPHWRAGVAA